MSGSVKFSSLCLLTLEMFILIASVEVVRVLLAAGPAGDPAGVCKPVNWRNIDIDIIT